LPDQLFQFSDFVHAVATPDGLKLQEYVEELVERPPINEVPEVERGAYQRPVPALRIPQDDQQAHADARQQQDTVQSPVSPRARDLDDGKIKPLCALPGTWQARKEQEDV
jgi:hypothetical protein